MRRQFNAIALRKFIQFIILLVLRETQLHYSCIASFFLHLHGYWLHKGMWEGGELESAVLIARHYRAGINVVKGIPEIQCNS